jgi:hypothetical protein
MPEFDCPNPVPVHVRIHGGELRITAEQRDTAEVTVSPWDGSDAARDSAERTLVEMRDGRLFVEAPDAALAFLPRRSRIRVDMRVPQDCPLALKVASADADCRGRYADLRLDSASGDANIEHVTGDADLHTASGDLRIDRIDGRATVGASSGDVTLLRVAGELTGGLASGDLRVDEAGDSVRLTNASGDLRVGCVQRGTVRLKTASGDVVVGVAQGTSVWLDVNTASGRTRNHLDMDAAPPVDGQTQLTLAIRTASGNVDIHRAAVPAAA